MVAVQLTVCWVRSCACPRACSCRLKAGNHAIMIFPGAGCLPCSSCFLYLFAQQCCLMLGLTRRAGFKEFVVTGRMPADVNLQAKGTGNVL
jgi:hypothetical protein